MPQANSKTPKGRPGLTRTKKQPARKARGRGPKTPDTPTGLAAESATEASGALPPTPEPARTRICRSGRPRGEIAIPAGTLVEIDAVGDGDRRIYGQIRMGMIDTVEHGEEAVISAARILRVCVADIAVGLEKHWDDTGFWIRLCRVLRYSQTLLAESGFKGLLPIEELIGQAWENLLNALCDGSKAAVSDFAPERGQ